MRLSIAVKWDTDFQDILRKMIIQEIDQNKKRSLFWPWWKKGKKRKRDCE